MVLASLVGCLEMTNNQMGTLAQGHPRSYVWYLGNPISPRKQTCAVLPQAHSATSATCYTRSSP